VDHEDFIARKYDGRRSASSGGADNDNGDVRTATLLIECKMTGGPGEKPKPLPKFVQHLEKVAEEAYLEGREPVVALRYYAPDSILANPHGWIDVAVRPVADDVEIS
jgi:hypothetical protein